MNQDFRDLLAEFNAHGVEYIVVGAHALAAHGHVRATKDLDDRSVATRRVSLPHCGRSVRRCRIYRSPTWRLPGLSFRLASLRFAST